MNMDPQLSPSRPSSAAPYSYTSSPPVTPCRRRLPAKLLDTATLESSIFSPMYQSTPDLNYARRPPIAPSNHINSVQPAGNPAVTCNNLASTTTSTMVPYTPEGVAAAAPSSSSYSPALNCVTPAAQLSSSYYHHNHVNHAYNNNSAHNSNNTNNNTPTISEVTSGRTPSPFAARFDNYNDGTPYSYYYSDERSVTNGSYSGDHAHGDTTSTTANNMHETYNYYENNTPLLSMSELAPPSPPLDDLLLSESFVSKCNVDSGVDKENRNPKVGTGYAAWSPLRIAADLRDGSHEAIAMATRIPSASLASLPAINNNNNNRAPLADITNQFVDVSAAEPAEFTLHRPTNNNDQDEENNMNILFDDIDDNDDIDYNTNAGDDDLDSSIYNDNNNTDVERKLEYLYNLTTDDYNYSNNNTNKKKNGRAIMPLKSALRMMR